MRHCGDVEVYPNFFCCSFVDYDSDKEITFEISERKNDLGSLVAFINKDLEYFISVNGIHYDNYIVMFLYNNAKYLYNCDYKTICKQLKILNDKIIDFPEELYTLSRYKRNIPWKSIDLFLYWSKMTRISKKLSLKSLAVNMNWPKIQELPIEPNLDVSSDQIDLIINYNLNDCRITKALAKRMKEDINLRLAAQKEYGFDCLSWDGVKLGYNILLKRYSDRTGIPMNELKEMRTRREKIDIGSLILPIVKFKEGTTRSRQYIKENKIITEFYSFYGLYKYLSNLTVSSTKEINCRVFVKDVCYDVKSGGLHTAHGPIVIRPVGKRYVDKDVSSYYPTLGAEWEFTPEHLGREFAEELNEIRKERLSLKANGLGKSNKANLLKLAMNGGFYGNTNNENTAMYDPKCMLSITINGQLFLLMLAERLIEIGATIDMCNTDGITIIYEPEMHNKVEEICDDWQKMTKMELESVDYIQVVRRDINNYIAAFPYFDKKTNVLTTDYKRKGTFLTDPPIDMSHDNIVVAKAVDAYFKNKQPVEDFITNHDNIYDFCACQKVSKEYTVYWNNEKQQRLNRYYVTKSGAYLYKSKKIGEMHHMLSGFPVTIFNDYEEKPMAEYNINYTYYISEAKKLIILLESSPTLF